MTDSPAVSAVVPATPEFVQVLRNVAAGVAARLDMAIDQIEEVRLAVTEAASLLLDEADATSLRLTIRRDLHTLDVRISADGSAKEWPSDRAVTSWPWMVVKGLSDDVTLDRDGDGLPSIVFQKRSERVAR
ncbi:MAG TPA: ATP-binding protein [Actinomycetota bacterium]|nr:ATP-binding protein [Actinomycetota bacterium]